MGSVLGSSPGGSFGEKMKLASLRAFRTLLQGIAAAFPAAGAGTGIVDAAYWKTFGYSCLAAGITALVSFLHNAAGFLPTDPTQTAETPTPAPAPAPVQPTT